MTPPLRLTLVRHGETDGQSSIRYHGRTDVPLSSLGRMQMHSARDALCREDFAAVYASTLSRSLEAAQIVGRTNLVTCVTGFNEIDFGEWEGLTLEEIRGRYPESYARWAENPSGFSYPGGDSMPRFRARVTRTLLEVLARAPAGALLLVVHKGIIRSILAELLRWGESERRALAVELGSIHIVRHGHGCWHPEVLDRTDHLSWHCS